MQRYVYLVDLEKCQKNEYLVAKIGLDTAENEPSEKCAFGCCVPPPPLELPENLYLSRVVIRLLYNYRITQLQGVERARIG